jgi:hypothetical protein
MASKLIFDPQTLIDEEKENEQKKVKEVISAQEAYDQLLEEENAKVRKQSDIKKSISKADKAIREVIYANTYGWGAWSEAKKKENLNRQNEWQDNTLLGKMFKTDKSKTLEEEYGDSYEIKPESASYILDGTTGPIESQTTIDAFAGETGQIESITHGFISGAIKIPYGFMNLGAMLIDFANKEKLPVNQSAVAQLDRWFEQTYFGNFMKYSEEKARENALGKLTEVIVQMYGGWKAVGTTGVKVADKAQKIFNKAYDGIKSGKYVRTAKNTNLSRGLKDVKKFNNLSRKQKFISIAVGGGVAGSVVYDAENIGTFGDLAVDLGFESGEITALDRKKKSTSKDEATRMLWNKLKFAGEMGFPIVPAIWGVGKVGKSIVSGVYKRAANVTKFDKMVEKIVSRPFRGRGPFPEEQFQAMQRLKGKGESAELLSQDFLKNIDDIVKRISRDSQVISNATGLTDGISQAIVKVINAGKFATSQGKVVVRGFDERSLKSFYKSMEQLKIPKNEIDNIIGEMRNIHQYWAQYLNTIAKGGNLNVGLKELTKVMNERIGDTLSTEYKIFKDNGLSPIDGYIVSREIKDEVAKIFQVNATAQGKSISKETARLQVDQVIRNVKLDPATGQPFFKYTPAGMAAEQALVTKSIAKNITGGGRFVADDVGELIQKESDLLAFQKLFGSYKNAMNVIANVTTDLAEISGRDRFYNVIKTAAKDQIARGERAIVYPSYNAAAKGWAATGEKIIEMSTGLKVPNKLGDAIYTPPISGMFTTESIAQGLIHGALNNLGSITKNIYYQAIIMAPKGLIQAGKTVGGPFTHARNFTSGAVTMVALGNVKYALTNPMVFGKSLWRSLNTIQPQLLWRNKPGVNYTAGSKVSAEELKKGGQSLYQFFLDEGMVNSSAIYRDVIGLIEDTQKIGWLQSIWGKMGRRTKSFLKAAQQMYVAEDDIWKVANFFIEDQKLHDAYAAALKKGLIKQADIPADLEIMKMATKKIREFMPNYAYVSEIVQASRRSPLGNFVSWSAEQIRTNTNIVMAAKADIKNPIFRQMGYERLFGWGFTMAAIPPLAVWGGMTAYGITKEQLYAIKEFVPWFSKGSTLIPVYEDGKYKYIDFSRAFFYDVVTNPMQSIITSLESNKDDPVLPATVKGMAAGFARFIEPFVAESIWIGGFLDVFARGGVTRKGSRIWNEEDAWGDKAWKTMKYLALLYSPGSAIQMRRLYHAYTGKTLKGTEYQMTDELLGLVGMRKAPLDIYRSMQINIGNFLGRESDERKLIYAGTLSGDPVTDDNKIIEQFIWANHQRLDAFNEMKRYYDAAKALKFKEKDIKDIFKARNRMDIYKMIKKNKFKPLTISDNMQKKYKELAERKGIENPLNKKVKKRIKKIIKRLKKQRLNKDYVIDKDKFLFKEGSIIDTIKEILPGKKEIKTIYETQAPPLGKTPQPVVNQTQMAQKDPITNLTRTETALLSPTEKVIAART